MTDAALTRALLEHREQLFALALAITRDHHAAEDVFQDAGVAAMQAASRGTAPEDVVAWLRTLVRHRAADFYRREARRADRPGPEAACFARIDQAFAEADVDPQEERARILHLRACLGRLGTRARAIVDGFYAEGRPIRGIATAIGWTENAVKVALAKARKALHGCLQRRLAAGPPP
jgi:RNA polymerase sigma-70 factor (ECF subfamily)